MVSKIEQIVKRPSIEFKKYDKIAYNVVNEKKVMILEDNLKVYFKKLIW